MTAWFKTKPKLASQASLHPDIVRSIHTMQDDLDGRTPATVSASDTLVAFQPGQGAEGVAFYAAPELQEATAASAPSQPATPPLSGSPFLADLPEQTPVSEPVALAPMASATGPSSSNTSAGAPPAGLPVVDAVTPAPPLPVAQPVPRSAPPVPPEPSAQTVPVDTKTELNPAAPKIMLKNLIHTYRWWLIGVGGAVVVTAILWFAWQWYREAALRKPIVAEGTVLAPEPAPAPQPAPAPTPEAPHYTTDQPNLLTFDTETATAQSMMTELLRIGMTIREDNLQEPVEFSIRDQKFNPLAFARFAYLLNLSLTPEMLVTLDEDFSLYYVLDQGRPRLGLSVKIKDPAGFNQAITAAEPTLPKALEAVFLDVTTAPKTGAQFRAGLYRDQPLRFANVDSTVNLSIDYAVRGDRWVVGTSQVTLRSILDRVAPAVAPEAQNAVETRLP